MAGLALSIKLTLGCAFLATVAGCGNPPGQDEAMNAGGNLADSPQTLYTITALSIAHAGPGKIVGRFHVTPSSSGIETDGLGGGCMVFEDPAGGVCNANSDCHVPPYITTPGPYAYCADKKCWIKPADRAQCWKSSYVTPPQLLSIGKPVETPEVSLSSLPDQLFTGPRKDKVNARVIACLNGKFVAGTKPPCALGPGKRVEDFGPVATLTK